MKETVFLGSIDKNFYDLVDYASENKIDYVYNYIQNASYNFDDKFILRDSASLLDKKVILGRKSGKVLSNLQSCGVETEMLPESKKGRGGFIRTETTIIGNYLFSAIYAPDMKAEKIQFLLFKDGKFLQTYLSDDHKFMIRLQESGIYYINGVVISDGKKYTSMSKMYEYITDEDKQEFNSFLDLIPARQNAAAKYYPYKYPYKDFVLMQNLYIDEKKAHSLGLNIYATSQVNILFYAASDMKKIKNARVCLSGGIKTDDTLIVGEEDISPDSNAKSYIGNYGGYTAVIDSGDSLIVTSDYFSTGKIYYYLRNNHFVISNRYHLLLNVLALAGIKGEIDTENTLSFLGVNDFLWGEQPTNEKMIVKNTYCLAYDKNLAHSNGKWVMANAKISEINSIDPKKKINSCRYQNEISKVTDDFRENIRSVINNPRFKTVVCDLGGDLDSRMMFGAVANIPGSDKKVLIKTEPFPDKIDFDIATSMADNFNFHYDFKLSENSRHSAVTEKYSVSELLDIAASLQLGTFFGMDRFLAPLVNEPDHAELWRVTSEAVTRPYITYDKFTDEYNVDDPAEWSDLISRSLCRSSVCGYLNVNHYLSENITDAINKMPFKDIAHSYEMTYTAYRMRYHCDPAKWGGYTTYQFAPLQSRNSFLLFHKVYEDQRSFKYIFDLQQANNPLMTLFPYSSEECSNLYEKCKDDLLIKHSIRVSVSDDSEAYRADKEAYAQKKADTDIQTDPKYEANYDEYKNIKNMNEYLYNDMLPYFRKVMEYQNGIYIDKIGYSFLHAMRKALEQDASWLDNSKFRNIYRKIKSLGIIISIFENV